MPRAIPALLLAAAAAGGCATPLIRDGVVSPGRYAAALQRTSASWGGQLETPVPARVIRRDEVGALLRELIAEEWGTDEIVAYQDGLVAVGLWPADRDLIQEQVAVSREEVAGLYAPTRRTLFVVGDHRVPLSLRLRSALARTDLFWETILAHELVHALQHQAHPELMEALLWRGQDDAANAASAAIEGDAIRYGFEALGVPRLPDPALMRRETEAATGDDDGALARAPALLRLTLLVPYVEGYRLSYSEGRALLESPPASTEQVLHPERRSEAFVAIDLAPLQPLLPGDCRLLSENGMGELGISVLLRDLGGEATSPTAWHGWHGDRYLAAHCAGRRAFVWVTAWDSDADAVEFEAAYRRIASAVADRAALGAPPRVRRRGREVHVWSEGLAALAEQLDAAPRRTPVSTLGEIQASFPSDSEASAPGADPIRRW